MKRADTARLYDRLSRWYDWLAGGAERRLSFLALQKLSLKEGEWVLEIGPGTGTALERIATAVGQVGRAYGVDISSGMLLKAREKLVTTGFLDRVGLLCGDGTWLPFRSGALDAIFMSFTLELFASPDIALVLDECWRVLGSPGRLVIVTLSRRPGFPLMTWLYEQAGRYFPRWVDCRRINPLPALHRAGFHISLRREERMWGLPVDILRAEKYASRGLWPPSG